MKAAAFSLLLLAGILTGCESADGNGSVSEDSDFIVFGHFYGECTGEQCIEIFKLTSDEVFEDQEDDYPPLNQDPTGFYDGDFILRSDISPASLTILWENFPDQLLNVRSGTVFGSPDVVDQGGLYLEYKTGKTHKYWILDNEQSSIPQYLHNYREAIHNAISKINN